LGAASVAEEATPKPGAQRPIAKDMHKAENSKDMNNQGVIRAIMTMK
jgi:hypothetical protein